MNLKLINKKKQAEDTFSFYFEKSTSFFFLPGQFIYLTLPKLNYKDDRGPSRQFTISSSPTEDNIAITTRIREKSGFKKTLNELEIGSIVDVEGPNGTLILDEKESRHNHVFLAGGIGITPFRSFIKYNIDKKLNVPMNLIYSNKSPENISFREELESWDENYDFFKLFMTITKPEYSETNWSGQKGRIDDLMISKTLKNWNLEIGNLIFWIVGPPPFVDAMEIILKKQNVSPSQVRSEKFTGY